MAIRNKLIVGSIIAVMAGGAVAGSAIASQRIGDDDLSPLFGTNQNRQSYGSIAELEGPDTWPDLVLVVNSEGKVGFVYADELAAAQGWGVVTTPEEAIQWMEYTSTRSAPTLRMFEKDGSTVIGVFDGLDWGTPIEESVE